MDVLRNWFRTIENPKNNFIEILYDEFSNLLDATKNNGNTQNDCNNNQEPQWILSGNVIIKERRNKLESRENSSDVFNLTLDNEEFKGCLDVDGNGRGSLKKINKINGLYEYLAEGTFVNGHLDGKIKERKSCTFLADGYYSRGMRHGPYRKFDVSKKYAEIGFYVNGYKRGWFCSKYGGGCYVIGQRVAENILQSCHFIYPNLQRAIFGNFEICENDKSSHVRLIEGRFVKIVNVSWDAGFPIPETEITNPETLVYEQSTNTIICRLLTLSDPYEEETVFVASSKEPNAGEGLFSRNHVQAGNIVCFYNGVRYLKRRSECGKSYKQSDYRLALDKFTDLDIPSKYHKLENYKATLGHKVCHSFDKRKVNSKFDNFHHPRFGEIIALVSICDINTGDEILVNYNYKNIKDAPKWYRILWKSHKSKLDLAKL